jgi:hypothetical protein
MALFTFILGYRGGTYISQVEAEEVKRALSKWVDEVDLDVMFGLTNRSREHFRASFTEFEFHPVAISEVLNVWCVSTVVRGKFASVNIVKTEKV